LGAASIGYHSNQNCDATEPNDPAKPFLPASIPRQCCWMSDRRKEQEQIGSIFSQRLESNSPTRGKEMNGQRIQPDPLPPQWKARTDWSNAAGFIRPSFSFFNGERLRGHPHRRRRTRGSADVEDNSGINSGEASTAPN
jgi:hypothetical protein